MTINGFIVVRLPRFNYREIYTEPPKRTRIPLVGEIYYNGIDRQQWSDVFDEDYYAKKMPAEIRSIASAVKTSGDDVVGIDLCRDEVAASKLLAYSNRRSVSNELIAVRSPSLEPIKGVIQTDLAVEWIGFDFFAMGEWSIIAGGMFMYPEHYSAWFSRINRFGLFDDSSLLTDYMQAYEQAIAAGQSEPLAPQTSGYEKIAIEIGRIRPKS